MVDDSFLFYCKMYACVYVKCSLEKVVIIFFLHSLSVYEIYVVALYVIKYVKKEIKKFSYLCRYDGMEQSE